MKFKKFTFCFIITITGCVYEPPPILYSFSIINNASNPIYIESETIKDSYIRYDTLAEGQELKREMTKMQCYDDYYKDTLVSAFFKKLKVTVLEKKVNIDPLKRNNWKEKLELKEGSCKEGSVYYRLEIYNKDIIE